MIENQNVFIIIVRTNFSINIITITVFKIDFFLAQVELYMAELFNKVRDAADPELELGLSDHLLTNVKMCRAMCNVQCANIK